MLAAPPREWRIDRGGGLSRYAALKLGGVTDNGVTGSVAGAAGADFASSGAIVWSVAGAGMSTSGIGTGASAGGSAWHWGAGAAAWAAGRRLDFGVMSVTMIGAALLIALRTGAWLSSTASSAACSSMVAVSPTPRELTWNVGRTASMASTCCRRSWLASRIGRVARWVGLLRKRGSGLRVQDQSFRFARCGTEVLRRGDDAARRQRRMSSLSASCARVNATTTSSACCAPSRAAFVICAVLPNCECQTISNSFSRAVLPPMKKGGRWRPPLSLARCCAYVDGGAGSLPSRRSRAARCAISTFGGPHALGTRRLRLSSAGAGANTSFPPVPGRSRRQASTRSAAPDRAVGDAPGSGARMMGTGW